MRGRLVGRVGGVYVGVPVGTGLAVYILAVLLLSSAVWLACILAVVAVICSGLLIRGAVLMGLIAWGFSKNPRAMRLAWVKGWRKHRAPRMVFKTAQDDQAALEAQSRSELALAAEQQRIHGERAEILRQRRLALSPNPAFELTGQLHAPALIAEAEELAQTRCHR